MVISVDESATDGRAGVIAAVRDHEPGDEIPVVVVRDGEEETFDVTLVERPARLTGEPAGCGRRTAPIASPSCAWGLVPDTS